ncbi:MAG: hypothetical protein KJ067_23205 [Vicinamibacteria bacterium]|nr:hypothetical protein [Vicinamibacteria bacterium]
METILTQLQPVITVLAPDADRYNGNPETRKVNMALLDHVTFLLSEGAGGTGTAKLQVIAYDKDGNNGEAIAFKYRVTAAGSFEPFGAVQDASVAADGYTTVAGASKQIAIEVQGKGKPEDKPLVALRITEVVNDPVDAGVVAVCSRARYGVGEAATFTTA